MAVYTPITDDQAASFAAGFDIGDFAGIEAIAQGVSNTNYHLRTSRGRYILTLFEPHRVEGGDLPFFLGYAAHLAAAGIPAAQPVADRNGNLSGALAGKPAAIMTFCEGRHPDPAMIDAASCRAAGTMTARMHMAGASFAQERENKYALPRWRAWIEGMGDNLNDIAFGLTDALRGELMELERAWPEQGDLPRGAVHADLFPDNVFFSGDTISGVIDFHFACTDFFAYDLAIVVNAWCFDEHARFVPERHAALMDGYSVARPLSVTEKKALPVLLRGAALRFTLSRCEETLRHNPGDAVTPHDPLAFVRRLGHFQNG